MSKKSKIRFNFSPLSQGGHSRLKMVVFDTDNHPMKPVYGFGGVVKDGVPQLWEDAAKIEKFSFWTESNEMIWLFQKWTEVSKDPSVLRGFIADSDYPMSGSIRQQFAKVIKREEPKSFIYQLKLKMPSGQYELFSTIGIVDNETGEVQDDWKSCLRDLQGRYEQWRSRNPEKVNQIVLAVVLGDGKNRYDNPRLAPWLIDFNQNTGQFMRKGRREVTKIHDEAVQKRAQDTAELISNYTA